MPIGTDDLPPGIQGQVLRQSERRVVVIYLRDDRLWIADFIDARGELFDAVTWFRFNCGTHDSRPARRRMVLESAIPLSAEVVTQIERLHAQAPEHPRLTASPAGRKDPSDR
jgi:hypothetical protein